MMFVRHPEVVMPRAIVGQSDVALSARGLAQVDGILALLPQSARPITSDLSRCLAVARRFEQHVIDARWREQSFGEWEGRTWDEVDGRSYLEHWTTATPPGGESIAEVRARVAEALRDVDDESVVITHAGPIRCVLSLTRGLTLEQAFKIPIDYAAVIHINHERSRA